MLQIQCIPFFLNKTSTTQIYTLSLHDALPISVESPAHAVFQLMQQIQHRVPRHNTDHMVGIMTRDPMLDLLRSEEHTSELQSHVNLVCRLLLEKKKIHIYALAIHSYNFYQVNT